MSRHLAYTQPWFRVFEHMEKYYILLLFASKVVLVILLRVEGGIWKKCFYFIILWATSNLLLWCHCDKTGGKLTQKYLELTIFVIIYQWYEVVFYGFMLSFILLWVEKDKPSSRMKCEVYRNTLSAQIQPNASKLIGQCITLQQGNHPINTVKAIKEFFFGKNVECSWPAMSITYSEHAFHCQKKILVNKQGPKMAAVQAWKSITRKKT